MIKSGVTGLVDRKEGESFREALERGKKSGRLSKSIRKVSDVPANILIALDAIFGTVLDFIIVMFLIIVLLISTIFGSLLAVSDVSGISTGVSGGKNGSLSSVELDSYDWWGNMTTNLNRLTSDTDKAIYRVFAMCQRYSNYVKSKSEPYRISGYTFYGMKIFEGGAFTTSEDIFTMPAKSGIGGDCLGDVPFGITFSQIQAISDASIKKDYSWEEFTYDNLSSEAKKRLQDNAVQVNAKGAGLTGAFTEVHDFVEAYYPSALRFISKRSFYRPFDMSSGEGQHVDTTIRAKLKEYGLEDSVSNIELIKYMCQYSGHHGTDNDTLDIVIEVGVSALKYADGDISNYSMELNGDYGNMAKYKNTFMGTYVAGDTGTDFHSMTSAGGYTLSVKKGGSVEKITKPLMAQLYDTYKKDHSGWNKLDSMIVPVEGGGRFSMNYGTGIATYIFGRAVAYDLLSNKCGVQFGVISQDDSAFGGNGEHRQLMNKLLQAMHDKYLGANLCGSSYSLDVNGKTYSGTMVASEWCASTAYNLSVNCFGGSDNFKKIYGDIISSGNVNYAGWNFRLNSDVWGDGTYKNLSVSDGAKLIKATDNQNTNDYWMRRCVETGNVRVHDLYAEVVYYKQGNDVYVKKESTHYVPKTGDVICYWKPKGYYSGGIHDRSSNHTGFAWKQSTEDKETIITLEGNGGSGVVVSNTKKLYYGEDNGWSNGGIRVVFEPNYEYFDTGSSSGSDSSFNSLVKEAGYLSSSLGNTNQLIIVKSSGSSAKVYCYEKVSGVWKKKYDEVSGYVGSEGVSSDCKEGSSRTPKGLYSLGFAFGHVSKSEANIKMDYKQTNSNTYWIDDTKSPNYNQWYEGNLNGVHAEHINDIASYKYAMLIQYNYGSNCVKGKGSAFFLHCSNGSATQGCVAIAESAMKNVYSWIDSTKNPSILIY